MALKWPDKDPEEILDYPVQFDDWLVAGCDILGGSPGPKVEQEGVSDPGTSVSPLIPIVVDEVYVAGKSIVVWLSGGTVGEKYTFKITAQDTATPARTVIRRVTIKVKEK